MEQSASSSVDTPRPDHNWPPYSEGGTVPSLAPAYLDSKRIDEERVSSSGSGEEVDVSSLPSLPPIHNLRIARAIWLKIEEGLARGDPKVLKITEQLEATFRPQIANINSFEQPPSTPVLPSFFRGGHHHQQPHQHSHLHHLLPPSGARNPASVVMIAERGSALEAGSTLMSRNYILFRLVVFCLLSIGTIPTYMFGPAIRDTMFQEGYCQRRNDRSYAPSFFLRSPTPQLRSDYYFAGSGADSAQSSMVQCARGPMRQILMLSVLSVVFEHSQSGLLLMYRHKLPMKALVGFGLLVRGLALVWMGTFSQKYRIYLPKEFTLFVLALGGEPTFLFILSLASYLANRNHKPALSTLQPVPEMAAESQKVGMDATKISSTLIFVRFLAAFMLVRPRFVDGLVHLGVLCIALSVIPVLLSKVGWNKRGRPKHWFRDLIGTEMSAISMCSHLTTPAFVDSAKIMLTYKGIVVCLSSVASSIHLTMALTIMRSVRDEQRALVLCLMFIFPLSLFILQKWKLLCTAVFPCILYIFQLLPYFHEQIAQPNQFGFAPITRIDQLLVITAACGLAALAVQHCYFITKSLLKDEQSCLNYTPFYGFVLLLSGLASANAYYFIAYRAYSFLYGSLAIITLLPLAVRFISSQVKT